MPADLSGYRNILVATDFSLHSAAAARLAVWLAEQNQAKVVVAHVLGDLRRAVHNASYQARLYMAYGGGDLLEREVRKSSDTRLKHVISGLSHADIRFETLLGEPFLEIVHAVQQEKYDLVVAGTRGQSAWKRYFVGSTAQRLIRKCPCSVLVAKAEHAAPPKVVLAATDFSDVSRRALAEGQWIAERAGAAFHVLHVMDSAEAPRDLLESAPTGLTWSSLRKQIRAEASQRFQEFLASLPPRAGQAQGHLIWGTPWREIGRLTRKLRADLVAIGTVGRSGIAGVLLGNTAEKVLAHCDTSILTAKSPDFVSPISPATWTLHPGPAEDHTTKLAASLRASTMKVGPIRDAHLFSSECNHVRRTKTQQTVAGRRLAWHGASGP